MENLLIRTFRYTAAFAGISAVVLLAGCAPSDSGTLDPEADITSQTLTISTWPEYYPPSLAADFEEATGVKVTIVHHATNEEGLAKVTASADSGIDIAFLAGSFVNVLVEEGLASELDQSLIPNMANLYPETLELDYDPGLAHSMPYGWGTTGLCYRSDLVETAPTSWGDLLEPSAAVTGKTTMLDDLRWMFMPAQKYLGYSLNTTDEAELREVADLLKSTSSTLLAYDNTTYGDKLLAGEAVLSEGYDGWCNTAAASDPNIKFVLPEEGADLWVDSMVLLKTSKNKEAAHAFMNYVLEAEVGAWVAENLLYNVPNQAAMNSLPDSLFEQYGALTKDGAAMAAMEQIEDVGDALELYNLLSTEVRAG